MAKLTSEEELVARAWINDFLVMSELKAPSADKRAAFATKPYEYMQGSPDLAKGKAAAKAIANELMKHEHVNIDSYIDRLSKFPFGDSLSDHYNVVYATPKTLAGFLAYFCASIRTYFDDDAMFDDEREQFFENNMFAQALKAFGALTTLRGKPTADEWPIVTKIYIADKEAAGEKGTHKYRVGLPPKDDYKSSGPKSGMARGLIGKPGEKIYVDDDDTLYCISANHKFAHRNPQLAFIRPLKPEGATADGKSNKVYFGSCNGYRECPVFITDASDATKLLEKMRDTGLVKPELDAVVIYELKKKAPGGYFKLSTEFGIDVLVKASKFNEQLEGEDDDEIDLTECKQLETESVKETVEKPIAEKYGKGYRIDPIAFSKMGHLSDN